MTTLLIQAHPRDDSLSRAIFDIAESALSPDLSVVRLYQGDALTTAALADARELVVVAPTWWGAMPAILLEPLQRLLDPWVDGKEPHASCPLRHVGRITVITTHGSRRLINRLQGEPGKQLWQRTLLPLCSPRAEFDWVALYGVDRISPVEIEAFLDEVGHRLRQAVR